MCMSSSLLPLLCDPEGKAKDRTSSFICPHISSTVISHLMKMLGLTKLGKEKKITNPLLQILFGTQLTINK